MNQTSKLNKFKIIIASISFTVFSFLFILVRLFIKKDMFILHTVGTSSKDSYLENTRCLKNINIKKFNNYNQLSEIINYMQNNKINNSIFKFQYPMSTDIIKMMQDKYNLQLYTFYNQSNNNLLSKSILGVHKDNKYLIAKIKLNGGSNLCTIVIPQILPEDTLNSDIKDLMSFTEKE